MKNYTSSVPAQQTIAEIERLLVRAGARGVSKDYDADGQVISLSFTIANPETKLPMGIRLPASPADVYEVFRQGRGKMLKRSEERLRKQAERTAWRLMLDWVAVQLSLIEMRQAELAQVFLPYLWSDQGTTFYQHLKASKFAALGYAPKTPDQLGELKV
jgi:hypothetical protein